MSTQKQIEANRRNALKFCGPKTIEGKAAVRLNSLRHGLRARTVVLPGEKREEFEQLCADLEAEWQPLTRTEEFYLEQMAIAQWKLKRMETAEASLYAPECGPHIQIPLLNRLWQAQHAQERAYARAQRDLERTQELRSVDEVQPEDESPSEADLTQSPTPNPQPSPFERPRHIAAISASDALWVVPSKSDVVLTNAPGNTSSRTGAPREPSLGAATVRELCGSFDLDPLCISV